MISVFYIVNPLSKVYTNQNILVVNIDENKNKSCTLWYIYEIIHVGISNIDEVVYIKYNNNLSQLTNCEIVLAIEIYTLILHFAFLFSLFVFVSAAGHYFRIWTGQLPALFWIKSIIYQIVHVTSGHLAIYGPVRHQKNIIWTSEASVHIIFFWWRTGPYTAIWHSVPWTICYTFNYVST